MKNRGKILIYNLIKIPPIFHWAQAAPTRYRHRSHWGIERNGKGGEVDSDAQLEHGRRLSIKVHG